jgi:hypothetical protein
MNPFTVQTVRCAGPGCTNVRREANHWFVTRSIGVEEKRRFLCFPFAPGYKLKKFDEPACGGACAQKLFEKYLSK